VTLRFIEGVAGSGKTTALLRILEDRVASEALGDQQRVLALTFMHGSRRRLEGRLRALPGLRGRFDCLTIDSFAWQLVRRWRSRAMDQWGKACPTETDFDRTCEWAAELMRSPGVGAWIARRYPITVIDELQDCRSWRLRIVQYLVTESECFAAADDFQDLADPPSDEAVVWARASGAPVELRVVHRTACAGLLEAARVLRAREALSNGTGFKMLRARNPEVGASFVARNLTWWWEGPRTDIAILTPTGPSSSKFLRRLLTRLSEKPFERARERFGPFEVPWEDPEGDDADAIANVLGLEQERRLVHVDQLARLAKGFLAYELCEWSDAQRRLRGRVEFAAGEILEQLSRARQRRRVHRHIGSQRIRAMTIHQAKNREFDSVIVVWPLEIPADVDRRRRLLYNAITRAKKQAVLIVQDPKEEVTARPPFTADA
jgi:superfamily I DNA/RNA helicase